MLSSPFFYFFYIIFYLLLPPDHAGGVGPEVGVQVWHEGVLDAGFVPRVPGGQGGQEAWVETVLERVLSHDKRIENYWIVSPRLDN